MKTTRRHLIALAAFTLGMLVLSANRQVGANELDWDLTVAMGFGRPTGTGADTYNLGPVGTISGGPRINDFLAIHAQLYLGKLALEKADFLDKSDGSMILFALAPEFDPLGAVSWLKVGLGPYIGVGVIQADILFDDVKTAARQSAVYVGGRVSLFATIPSTGFGAGIEGIYAAMFPLKECTSTANVTVCDTDPERIEEGLFALTFALRLTFD